MPRKIVKNRGLGAFGNLSQPDERYLFGTEAERQARVQTNYTSPPSVNPSSFSQIRPGPAGSDLNDQQPTGKRGAPKFGSPRRYA